MRFTCSTCGGQHDLDRISLGAAAPLQWNSISDEERARSHLGDEQCEIDCREGLGFYIRACLEIPIRGADRSFSWGVWCSLSEKSYLEVSEHWDDPNRTDFGPYFGRLSTVIPGYPDTAFLKTSVVQREVGFRPLVDLEPTDHPLAVDQRLGIDPERLRRIVIDVLHAD